MPAKMPEPTPAQGERKVGVLFMAFFTQDYQKGGEARFLMHCDLCGENKKGFPTKQEAQQFGEEHSHAVHWKS